LANTFPNWSACVHIKHKLNLDCSLSLYRESNAVRKDDKPTVNGHTGRVCLHNCLYCIVSVCLLLRSFRKLLVQYHFEVLYGFVISDKMLEFCLLETFRPECWKNEVIVVEEAIYGRRHIGKCIKPEDVIEGVEDNPQYLGCHANVLSLLHMKCSGKKQCEVHVPDADLQRTKPCRRGLTLFLEVRYRCVEGKGW